MKSIFKTILLFSILFSPALLSAKTFEGTVKMTISGKGSGSHDISYSVKGSKIRTDMTGGRGQNASAIIDLEQQQVIVLMAAQSMYMVMPMQKAMDQAGQGAADTTLENTGITRDILGYECTKYLAHSSEGTTEIWATTELGGFGGLGGGMSGPMGRAKPKPAWEQALVGRDFFPLLVITHHKGKESFTLRTTAVEPKSLPESMFTAPEGYRKFDMGAMMQGMGGQMFGQ